MATLLQLDQSEVQRHRRYHNNDLSLKESARFEDPGRPTKYVDLPRV